MADIFKNVNVLEFGIRMAFLTEKILLDALVLNSNLCTALCSVWSSYRSITLVVKIYLTREA